MGNPATIPMLSPPDAQDSPNTWGPVPITQVARARARGGVVGINVKGPDGTVAPVRADRVHEAVANGGQIVPIEPGGPPQPPEGFWSTLGSDLSNIPAGLANMGRMVGEGMSGAPGPAIVQAGVNGINQNANEKAAGYSLPYRIAAGIAGQTGTNVSGMEQAAAQGNPNAVLGHAAAGATVASAPLLAEGVLRGANEIIPSTTRAGQGIGILKDQLAAQPVTGKLPSYKLGSDLLGKWDRTGAPVPPQLRAYVERVSDASASGQPVTFQDLWEHREALNDLKYSQGLPGKAVRQIGQVASGLTDEMQGIADNSGLGKDWASQQREYARGQKIMRGADAVGPAVGGAAGAIAGRNLGAIGAAEAAGAGAIAGKYVGKPVIGGITRALIERNAGPPSLSQVPAPPSTAPSFNSVPPQPAYIPTTSLAPVTETNAEGLKYSAFPEPYKAQAKQAVTQGAGANYSAADLAALKARNAISAVPRPPAIAPDNVELPQRGVEFKERFTPDELDTNAWSLFGKENYRDLSPDQQNYVVQAMSKRSVGTPLNTLKPPSTALPGPPAPPDISIDRRTGSDNAPANDLRSGIDRRDQASRDAFAALSPEQQYQAAFVDKSTGLPNRRALESAPPAGAYAVSDVAGLKGLNDNPLYGMGAGDALLSAKADALRNAGLQSFRYGGDEFAHLGETPEALQQRLQQANNTFGQEGFRYRAPNGKTYEFKGASFRHGIGRSFEEAMQNMTNAKLADKANARGTTGQMAISEVPTP